MHFLDLPIELLPLILEHLSEPRHLVAICLVSHSFYTFASPKLYEWAAIHAWHKNGKAKVICLFNTLAHCPHLAQHVRKLEICDFPKSLTGTVRACTLVTVLQGLRNCVNLRSCTWTRDGSLTSSILEALQTCQYLQALKVNGHHEGNYDPQCFLQFKRLRSISLVMPSAAVVETLTPWMKFTGPTLNSLTLICESSPIITDALLESLSASLVHLKDLNITGCPNVTYKGVWALISSSKNIFCLGLECLSKNFDMAKLSHLCIQSGNLRRLQSVTISTDQQDGMIYVCDLLSQSPLESFRIFSTGAVFEASTMDEFWSRIVTAHGKRLTRFSVHRMFTSLGAVEDICRRCQRLRELFVVVEQGRLDRLSLCLSFAHDLRIVHINYPFEGRVIPIIDPAAALKVVRRCSSTLTRFGCNTRIYSVERVVKVRQEDGSVETEPRVEPYEGTDVPEPFFVVRA